MTKTNNRSARGLDDRGQAEPPGLSVGSCSIASFGRLSHIKEVKPREVISFYSLDDRGPVTQSRTTTLHRRPQVSSPSENAPHLPLNPLAEATPMPSDLNPLPPC